MVVTVPSSARRKPRSVPPASSVIADRLAAIVDVHNRGGGGGRDIDVGEVAAPVAQEAVDGSSGVDVAADDPTRVVDSGGEG